MLKRVYAIVLICVLSVYLFSGCNVEVVNATVPAKSDIIGETEPDYTEANSKIAGIWAIGGVTLSGKIYDISQKEELESIYQSTILILGENGTFTYFNFLTYEGTYSWKDETTILLYANTVYNIDDTAAEDINNRVFIATVLDDTTLQWDDYDPIMGAVQHEYEKNTYYLEREGAESQYVLDNCTPLN